MHTCIFAYMHTQYSCKYRYIYIYMASGDQFLFYEGVQRQLRKYLSEANLAKELHFQRDLALQPIFVCKPVR